jgi:hypothetical protein
MRYSSVRGTIRSGDAILWSGTGLAARIVRRLTRSRWSHVGVAVWWGPRLMVLDSYPFRGTRARPLSHDLKGAHWLATGANWSMDAHGFALDELDRPYSLLNLWKTWLGLDLIGSEYHCAQYAAAVLAKAGLTLTSPATPESIAHEAPLCPNGQPQSITHIA